MIRGIGISPLVTALDPAPMKQIGRKLVLALGLEDSL